MSHDDRSARPLFIVFEGIEGSGKSTQIRLVAEALRRCGVEPVVTREPGGTPAGEAIRAVVLDERLQLDEIAELMLMLAARSAFVRQVVRPALEAGRVVLADRYQLSTFAYQGGGRGIELDRLRALNDLATGGVSPDLCVLLDVDVEVGHRRAGGPETRDRIEGEDLAFHRRVADAYRRLAANEPDVALVDGNGEIQRVRTAVWKALSSRFPETFPPRGC
ncbi:MAG: dTMP kinase [Gemmatimonadetes bacterium]|uniref:Thymidylate kinase n=1 Tax=Candidatus Kutchimonas denitrificans TaxID=3056748 RepID=A0AAE4Z7L4_9BACT|nr:dTMP kinase [Gemmatimonadota bacterium]NIR73942.1 dTMP kinase [Candidatus Kutchimonas denitrificans]NIR99748.1 dTMP kinase [Gemmatimonadota bacterium]NIT65333.1 dTMP kinase [Gemmatimonadota bacterium]NIW73782.1 dTMP kinase [Gemmatimonadota bacterium]